MSPSPISLPSDLQTAIVTLLRERGSRLLALKEIGDRLPDHDATPEQIALAVEQLEQDGAIVAVRGKRYSLLEFTPYHSGRIRVHPDGYGTIFGGNEEPDIYIDRKVMKGAMNGDLVIVRVDKQKPQFHKLRSRKLIVGEVSTVLSRAHRTVVGRFHQNQERPFVTPFDSRLDHDVVIEPDATMGAAEGVMVNVEIDRYPDRTITVARGRVVEVIGFLGDPGVDIELVIRKLHIPHAFPGEVLREAEAIPTEVPAAALKGRTDLRDHNIVTIDGETAKDFDDAVEVQVLPNGNFLLGVHIADVAHYVREGSQLDDEAFERGTSVYFPGRAVPMLPERLSNGICSLNPRVDRLTFSVDMEIDRRGRFVERRAYKSVIRTKERMTYTNVNAILVGEGIAEPSGPAPTGVVVPSLEELRDRYGSLLPEFRRMHELYLVLAARREKRGSIDFDLPEAEVMLDAAGAIEAIKPTERNVAHRLIEEFMLSANECVAQELVFASQPGIFRVHQQPDPQKLQDLRDILKEFKLTLRGDVEDIRPTELQRVMKAVAGTPEERFLSNIVLRSMKRAFYSDEDIGHFALGLEHYCHFTSPIRRYPDLIVHRRLAELVESGALYGPRLEQIERAHPLYAAQSSERERRADEAEREVLEWKKVIFMRDKVGMQFTGIVAGVAPFGLFVELDEIFVQGMVPVATIGGDFWQFREREHRLRGDASAREMRLGDHVKIEVKSIDEDRHQLEFRLLEVGGSPIAQRERDASPDPRSGPGAGRARPGKRAKTP